MITPVDIAEVAVNVVGAALPTTLDCVVVAEVALPPLDVTAGFFTSAAEPAI